MVAAPQAYSPACPAVNGIGEPSGVGLRTGAARAWGATAAVPATPNSVAIRTMAVERTRRVSMQSGLLPERDVVVVEVRDRDLSVQRIHGHRARGAELTEAGIAAERPEGLDLVVRRGHVHDHDRSRTLVGDVQVAVGDGEVPGAVDLGRGPGALCHRGARF